MSLENLGSANLSVVCGLCSEIAGMKKLTIHSAKHRRHRKEVKKRKKYYYNFC